MHGEIDRTRRISALIKRELADILLRDMNDPRVELASITSVVTSRDFRLATVYVSTLSDQSIQPAVDALNHAAGYLRRMLGPRLDTRNLPMLRFRADPTLAQGAYMSHLIDEARRRDHQLGDDHDE